jgi:hypothetical protein
VEQIVEIGERPEDSGKAQFTEGKACDESLAEPNRTVIFQIAEIMDFSKAREAYVGQCAKCVILDGNTQAADVRNQVW